MKKKYCLLTNDVETTSIWHNSLRDATGLKVWKEGMPRLLDLYEKYNVKSTFFFTGYIARLYPEIVKMIVPYGHEVASHGLVHDSDKAFDVLSYEDQLKHLQESKKILEDISGQEVISFRAPALRVNHNTPKALLEAGFKIDSSIASQRFDFMLSFGSKDKVKWFFAPRQPFITSKESLFTKGNDGLIEVTLNAYLFPYIGTTMRVFPTMTKMTRHVVNMENKMNGKPVVFLIHPNELIDESDEEVTKINRRSKGFISYLLADKLRRNLKTRNLGEGGLKLYAGEVDYFNRKKYNFTTVQTYARETFPERF